MLHTHQKIDELQKIYYALVYVVLVNILRRSTQMKSHSKLPVFSEITFAQEIRFNEKKYGQTKEFFAFKGPSFPPTNVRHFLLDKVVVKMQT